MFDNFARPSDDPDFPRGGVGAFFGSNWQWADGEAPSIGDSSAGATASATEDGGERYYLNVVVVLAANSVIALAEPADERGASRVDLAELANTAIERLGS